MQPLFRTSLTCLMVKGHTVFVLFLLYFLEHPPLSPILPRFLQPSTAEVCTEPPQVQEKRAEVRKYAERFRPRKETWGSPSWPHWLETGQISLCECTADQSLEQCSETVFRQFSCWLECQHHHVWIPALHSNGLKESNRTYHKIFFAPLIFETEVLMWGPDKAFKGNQKFCCSSDEELWYREEEKWSKAKDPRST